MCLALDAAIHVDTGSSLRLPVYTTYIIVSWGGNTEILLLRSGERCKEKKDSDW